MIDCQHYTVSSRTYVSVTMLTLLTLLLLGCDVPLSVEGVVKDQDGDPVAGAAVKLTNAKGREVAPSVTNDMGEFQIIQMGSADIYDMIVEAPGYLPQKLSFDNPAETIVFDVTLERAD